MTFNDTNTPDDTHDFTDEVQGRGLLVSLSIRQWTARKLDKKASKAAADASGSDVTRGNYHKVLIDPKLLKPINTVARKARSYHDNMTVPWTYDGVGMLPVDMVDEYDIHMGELETEFYMEVEKLVSAYPSAVAAAARELGSLFNINEYPATDDVKGRFSFFSRMSMLPASASEDMRTNIPDRVVDRIAASVRSEYDQLGQAIQKRLMDSVTHALERIKTYDENLGTDSPARLYDSLGPSFNDSVRLASMANLGGDEAVQSTIDALQGLVIDVSKVRSDSEYRRLVIGRLEAASNALA